MTGNQFYRIARRVLGASFAVSMVILFLLTISIYRSGSLTPDPSTGRTYAFQEHGTLYVVPSLGIASTITVFVGIFSLALLLALAYRFERPRFHFPWDERK